jgi:hypothetical protein
VKLLEESEWVFVEEVLGGMQRGKVLLVIVAFPFSLFLFLLPPFYSTSNITLTWN